MKLLNALPIRPLLMKKIISLSWVDKASIALFLFIVASAAYLILRPATYIFVTMRLFERDAPDFYFNRPTHLYVEKLMPGLKETGGFGENLLEIVDIYRYRSNNTYIDTFVTIKTKAAYNKRKRQYSYNGTPLLIGSFRTFRLQSIIVNGVIVDISRTKDAREKKTFIIEGYLDPINHQNYLTYPDNITRGDGVENYIAQQVREGLKVVDIQGNVLAEVIQVKKTPGKFFSPLAPQTFISDPERTRVDLTLRVVAEKINDAYYFQKEGRLLVGQTLYFPFDRIHIWPTIISFRPLDEQQ